MPIVIDLDWRIDANLHRHRALLPIFAFDLQRYGLAGLNCLRQTNDRKDLRAVGCRDAIVDWVSSANAALLAGGQEFVPRLPGR